jgi:hypothetical protein
MPSFLSKIDEITTYPNTGIFIPLKETSKRIKDEVDKTYRINCD